MLLPTQCHPYEHILKNVLQWTHKTPILMLRILLLLE
uniref:Uncharacterized protein n=1 Tax=Rhizophora mucronata TaxID=61149 RepID=A0A2P2QSF8_RHIMU